MANKFVGFRIEETLWVQFQKLVDGSDRSVQEVLRMLVRTCVDSGSVEVEPLGEVRSGEDRSRELRLQEKIQRLRGFMVQKNYSDAEPCFYGLTSGMRRVRNRALLEEAEAVVMAYLKWNDDHQLKTGGYKHHNF